MGLLFGGIDFRCTPDDEWVCLEVNPSPGFTFFEAGTGQPIAAAAAEMLMQFDQTNNELRSDKVSLPDPIRIAIPPNCNSSFV
jgi:hypothetical protein